ncbi:MAG TPA: MMPL family transporter [Candidatus Saccharimonadales bacterium]|nr:MMPL family transporter [Candidatus Saccharimonadales bacterium]
MLERFGHLVFRFRVWFLVAGLVALIGGGVYAGGIYHSLTQGGFTVPGSQSQRADAVINTNLGGNRDSLVVLLSSTHLKVTDPAFTKAATDTLNWIANQPEVSSLASYYTLGDRHFLSNDQHRMYALVGLKGTEDQQAAAVNRLHAYLTRPSPLRIQLGGDAGVNAESTTYVEQDLRRAELITFPITAVLLLIIFRSVAAAALPLALGAYGVVGALVITRLVAHVTDISVYVINLISLLGLGLAIDYSLFIVSRFREEMVATDNDTKRALAQTMSTAGRTVMFSALTVLVALLGLTIFPIGFLRSMGIGGAAAVLVALLGALLFLPAILAMLEHKVNALHIRSILPRQIHAHVLRQDSWGRIARVVMRRPVITVLCTLGFLLLAGVPFLSIRFINPDYRILPPSSQARQVGEALQHDFSSNTQSPIQVVVRTAGPPSTPSNLGLLEAYGQRLQRLPGVHSIESPTAITAGPPAQLAAQLSALQNNAKAQAQLDQYANGQYVLLNIIPKTGTYDPATKHLVEAIRAAPVPRGLHVDVGGQTADLVDLLARIRHDGAYAAIVVFGAMVILFFLMLGSVVIPLKTVILNILSLSAAFGALVWIFQQGNWANLIGFTSEGGIDATQPVIILALAFGLSMDYAIFLFSRIKEHYDLHHDTRRAVIWGLQRTSGIITSAAILLMVVIAAFAAGRIEVMKEVAIGLIIAVLVDVFIVRLLLLPASMTLLGKHNWWAPGPLKKIHDRLGFSERP